jgi:3-deoxy-7-phosphoheptulonate synthase
MQKAKIQRGRSLKRHDEYLMMIVMKEGATDQQIDAVIQELNKSETVHAQRVDGEDVVVIAAIGDTAAVHNLNLEELEGVDRVVAISNAYKLASSELGKKEPLTIAGRIVGGDHFTIIAGPCTVETRSQTLNSAQAVYEGGADMLRGGAFKPRTSPFAFRGLGQEALEILIEAREQTGLPIVTELVDISAAEEVSEVADVIQIGARNMQNYALLEVVGKLGLPVLLKRGLSSTLDELLQAADYILKEGNENVILCERGIRTFDTAMRFTLDLGSVPWLQNHSHLPVIVDPSHAAGERRYVEALSRAAAAVGANGIIVEVHENPAEAVCDAAQQVYASDFAEFAVGVRSVADLIKTL